MLTQAMVCKVAQCAPTARMRAETTAIWANFACNDAPLLAAAHAMSSRKENTPAIQTVGYGIWHMVAVGDRDDDGEGALACFANVAVGQLKELAGGIFLHGARI